MRALLKSGDTQKVILFANTARDKDIYRMAGNYLQNLNWKENAQLMRQIEAFYLKAGAADLLANFYEACAQVLTLIAYKIAKVEPRVVKISTNILNIVN